MHTSKDWQTHIVSAVLSIDKLEINRKGYLAKIIKLQRKQTPQKLITQLKAKQ